MHACPLQTLNVNFACVRPILGRALTVFAFATTLLIARAPLSAPMSDLDLERQLMAGSDALLERMVIPPNRPDWIVMDCADGAAKDASVYDQVRRALCDARGEKNVASF